MRSSQGVTCSSWTGWRSCRSTAPRETRVWHTYWSRKVTPPLQKPAGGKGSPAKGKSRAKKKKTTKSNWAKPHTAVKCSWKKKKKYSPHVLVTLDVMLLLPNIMTHCNNVVGLTIWRYNTLEAKEKSILKFATNESKLCQQSNHSYS